MSQQEPRRGQRIRFATSKNADNQEMSQATIQDIKRKKAAASQKAQRDLRREAISNSLEPSDREHEQSQRSQDHQAQPASSRKLTPRSSIVPRSSSSGYQSGYDQLRYGSNPPEHGFHQGGYGQEEFAEYDNDYQETDPDLTGPDNGTPTPFQPPQKSGSANANEDLAEEEGADPQQRHLEEDSGHDSDALARQVDHYHTRRSENEEADDEEEYERDEPRPRREFNIVQTNGKKRKKAAGSAPQKRQRKLRPCNSDFDPFEKSILVDCQHLFRVVIGTVESFPDGDRPAELAEAVFDRVIKARQVKLDLTDAFRVSIIARGSQIRGEIKTKAQIVVAKHFKFINPSNTIGSAQTSRAYKKRIMRNRSMVERLTHEDAFLFKDYKARKGFGLSSALQELINLAWFANRTDEGPRFPDYFDPFPNCALALVATALENAIQEWTSGLFKQHEFSLVSFEERHQEFLALFEAFERAEEDASFGLRAKILRRARGNAGVTEAAPTPHMSIEAQNRAFAEAAGINYDEDTDDDISSLSDN